MSYNEIKKHLSEIYGLSLSPAQMSEITDQIKTAVSAYYLIFFSCVLVENLLLTALFVLSFAFSSPTTMVAELVEAALSP
jgi:uncharacterized membrane protein YvbJ